MSDDEKNPFKKGKKQDEWPTEVMKRFEMQAERMPTYSSTGVRALS